MLVRPTVYNSVEELLWGNFKCLSQALADSDIRQRKNSTFPFQTVFPIQFFTFSQKISPIHEIS